MEKLLIENLFLEHLLSDAALSSDSTNRNQTFFLQSSSKPLTLLDLFSNLGSELLCYSGQLSWIEIISLGTGQVNYSCTFLTAFKYYKMEKSMLFYKLCFSLKLAPCVLVWNTFEWLLSADCHDDDRGGLRGMRSWFLKVQLRKKMSDS